MREVLNGEGSCLAKPSACAALSSPSDQATFKTKSWSCVLEINTALGGRSEVALLGTSISVQILHQERRLPSN
ncbi:hypothetical protein KOW79_011483 [Hemibagrus wyckioides]|uniref:Uncharacterized protein n=1 Tax=Hemibagrus wyckioides TaxID=337641 RepID=A0A9D3NMY1_9TELE|nr:hypothetical protein KOW79_011483 [Hemibagrus wyckioides]